MDKACFAYTSKGNGCRALIDSSGCGPGCPFRKSTATHKSDRLNAYRLLARLPQEHQQYIAETYYKGKRPWLEAARNEVSV